MAAMGIQEMLPEAHRFRLQIRDPEGANGLHYMGWHRCKQAQAFCSSQSGRRFALPLQGWKDIDAHFSLLDTLEVRMIGGPDGVFTIIPALLPRQKPLILTGYHRVTCCARGINPPPVQYRNQDCPIQIVAFFTPGLPGRHGQQPRFWRLIS